MALSEKEKWSPVEDDCSVTSVNIEEGGVDHCSSDSKTLVDHHFNNEITYYLTECLSLTTPSWPSLLKICAAMVLQDQL